MLQPAHFLRLVDVAQGNVVRRRKGVGGEGLQRAHVDFAHRLAAAGAYGGEVAGGDERQPRAVAALPRCLLGECGGIHLGVGGSNGALQGLLLVLRALPSLAGLHVARTDKGQGADDAARRPIGTPGQCDHVLLRRARGRDHGGVQVLQQRQAFAQHADGVVVAAQYQQGRARLVQARNQVVVQRARVAGRGGGVKNIADHQHGIHLVLCHFGEQPLDQRRVLGLAALAHEVLAQVPVGGVKKAHTKVQCVAGGAVCQEGAARCGMGRYDTATPFFAGRWWPRSC